MKWRRSFRVLMARKHLEAADVSLLVIDATAGVLAGDATIGGYAYESGRSMVIVVNKWDLVTSKRTDGKPAADRKVFEEQLRHSLKFLAYVPVVFVSAAEGQNIEQVFADGSSSGRGTAEARWDGTDESLSGAVDFERAPCRCRERMSHPIYDAGRGRAADICAVYRS